MNPIRFELKKRHTATMQNNGYVRLEKSFYSVPTKYIGRKLNIIYDNTTVRIYSYTNELIAIHRRSHKLFEYVKILEHLPKNQQKYLTWDPADLLKEASSLHSDLEMFLEKVIDEKKYPEQAYKSCRGVLSLVPKVGLERLLKNKQDELPVEDLEGDELEMVTPEHENVRGSEYYK